MKRYHRLLLALAALLLLLGGGWFLYRTGFFAAPYAHLCFLLVQLLSVVLAPIPSNIVAAAGGLLFGAWPAFLLTFGAVTTGSLLTFSLARVLGRNFASLLVSRSLSVPLLPRRYSVHPGRADRHPPAPFCPHRGAGPALGTALRLRAGRGLHPAPPVGRAPLGTGWAGAVLAGAEVRGPAGGVYFDLFKKPRGGEG